MVGISRPFVVDAVADRHYPWVVQVCRDEDEKSGSIRFDVKGNPTFLGCAPPDNGCVAITTVLTRA
jgi:hypothetical protein